MTEQSPKIAVHFSPGVLARIPPSSDQLRGWTGFFHDWLHNNDPDWVFGRDVSNHPSGRGGYARHLHMMPSETEENQLLTDKWFRTEKPYNRTSDRFIIYSLNKQAPRENGMLILALVGDPGAHKICFRRPDSRQRLQDWEDLAFSHQVHGLLPTGTITCT